MLLCITATTVLKDMVRGRCLSKGRSDVRIREFYMPTRFKVDCVQEIDRGKRFEFGKNWSQFLTVLDEKRITVAEQSLKEMLGIDHLQGKSFLDIGSGSGLFSLAARRLGASVHSFDFDPQAVACTSELKKRYFSGDVSWAIEEASILDLDYLSSLGTFDIVYSWGVLHHTGAMWRALENARSKVAPGGYLFIALYNDQGGVSQRWKMVKRTYNWLPHDLKFLVLWPAFVRLWGPILCRDCLHGRPFSTWFHYKTRRGMSAWH